MLECTNKFIDLGSGILPELLCYSFWVHVSDCKFWDSQWKHTNKIPLSIFTDEEGAFGSLLQDSSDYLFESLDLWDIIEIFCKRERAVHSFRKGEKFTVYDTLMLNNLCDAWLSAVSRDYEGPTLYKDEHAFHAIFAYG